MNPHARRGRDELANARDRLRERGIELEEAGAVGREQCAAAIRDNAQGLDAVIVGGGDGSLSAAIGGVVDAGLPLGVLPLGTANNFARALGIPTDLDAACDVIAGGVTRPVDLGRVNDTWFLTTASLGLSVAITRELEAGTKRRWGMLAYAIAAFRILSRVRPHTAEIRWPGGTRLSRTVQIVIGNGPYYGSAMTVAEDATIDDARLDLYSIEMREWYRLLALLPALRRGSHGRKEDVFVLRTTELEIRTRRPRRVNVDGELEELTPAKFRVVPGAVKVFVPAGG